MIELVIDKKHTYLLNEMVSYVPIDNSFEIYKHFYEKYNFGKVDFNYNYIVKATTRYYLDSKFNYMLFKVEVYNNKPSLRVIDSDDHELADVCVYCKKENGTINNLIEFTTKAFKIDFKKEGDIHERKPETKRTTS